MSGESAGPAIPEKLDAVTIDTHLCPETAQQPTGLPAADSTISPRLKIHVDADSEPDAADIYQSEQPPTRQVEQLVEHLRLQQKELSQREADLQKATHTFETKVLATEANLRKQGLELEQHWSQIERQQEQLVQLQQNLVDHQAAIRSVVERLVVQSDDFKLKPELESLLEQLKHQSDLIANHWHRVIAAMSSK